MGPFQINWQSTSTILRTPYQYLHKCWSYHKMTKLKKWGDAFVSTLYAKMNYFLPHVCPLNWFAILGIMSWKKQESVVASKSDSMVSQLLESELLRQCECLTWTLGLEATNGSLGGIPMLQYHHKGIDGRWLSDLVTVHCCNEIGNMWGEPLQKACGEMQLENGSSFDMHLKRNANPMECWGAPQSAAVKVEKMSKWHGY